MNHIQFWVEGLQESLETCLGEAVHPLDFSNDRLKRIINHLSDDEAWDAFEASLNTHTI